MCRLSGRSVMHNFGVTMMVIMTLMIPLIATDESSSSSSSPESRLLQIENKKQVGGGIEDYGKVHHFTDDYGVWDPTPISGGAYPSKYYNSIQNPPDPSANVPLPSLMMECDSPSAPRPISYKDMITGSNGLPQSEKSVDLEDDDIDLLNDDFTIGMSDGILTIDFSDRVQSLVIKSMELTLAVKIHGRRVGYNTLLPGLPVTLYKRSFIEAIGTHIGSVIKMDFSTDNGCRGRFARMAVSINLRKPLDICPQLQAQNTTNLMPRENQESIIPAPTPKNPAPADPYGPWMLAERKKWGPDQISLRITLTNLPNQGGPLSSAHVNLGPTVELSSALRVNEKAEGKAPSNTKKYAALHGQKKKGISISKPSKVSQATSLAPMQATAYTGMNSGNCQVAMVE
ncbi:hypothetical protein F3Y22_tig00110239pilonHSYRG00039 [Hibiscus syriacus]|uniref:Uncharacterized protein n=1 Tax=Hibiscus syriacus TaxID=106335 RepID=A0A6A3BCT7_HIBSY|nr:hypothetical protein F3Y22_tig00110239pilonHSYRG00039 [Hibiscus syriacus]